MILIYISLFAVGVQLSCWTISDSHLPSSSLLNVWVICVNWYDPFTWCGYCQTEFVLEMVVSGSSTWQWLLYESNSILGVCLFAIIYFFNFCWTHCVMYRDMFFPGSLNFGFLFPGYFFLFPAISVGCYIYPCWGFLNLVATPDVLGSPQKSLRTHFPLTYLKPAT